jgi:hypothetical protein
MGGGEGEGEGPRASARRAHGIRNAVRREVKNSSSANSSVVGRKGGQQLQAPGEEAENTSRRWLQRVPLHDQGFCWS